jgi:eukaryotic-like serine/threonine-protein kinase
MALPPGSRVGPYEIVAAIGAGGMGEVYRARDTRLDRDVAVKILPDMFAADADRLARFEREARTLAALNHPHIAQIFGLESVQDATGNHRPGTSSALVMELVDGEDLADRIRGGPLPLDEALAIALQIAGALEAAHERGIVHRDLKPANVKVRPDGAVKVLDFGLAKALDAAPATDAPTFTSPAMTEMGVILGTAAYMAPEQAKGKAVDRRVDIWAFGCVLFEMLAGQRPFDGETVTELLAAVLTQPPEWTRLPPGLPPAVTHLLRRCLEKDPRRRLRDIGDARVVLEDPAALAPAAPAASAGLSARLFVAGVLAAGALAGAAGYLFAALRTGPPAAAAVLTSFRQLTDQPGVERQPTISPDGKTIVYVSDARGKHDLYLLRVGGRKSILLTEDSDADDYAPAFSPDGARIAFRSERSGGGIFVMEATGESVRRITDIGYDPSWSPDGRHLVVAAEAIEDPLGRSGDSHLWVVNVADGTRRRILAIDGVGPRWAPGGGRIVFWHMNAASQRDIATVAADGSEEVAPVPLTSDAHIDWSPTWSPDGRHVYFASSRGGTLNLWRVAIDEASGRPLAPPEPITTPTAWSGYFGFSADGRSLVFATREERATIWAAQFDPAAGIVTGQPRQVLQGHAINSIDLSRDGQTIVFSQRGQPWEALGLVRVDGSGWSRLTDDSVYHRLPAWSPDGTRIAFFTNTGGGAFLATLRSDGSGQTAIPVGGKRSVFYPVWSPDGSRIAVGLEIGPGPGRNMTFAIIDVTASPAAVRVLPADPAHTDVRTYSWSPDGRRLAAISRAAMRDTTLVVDVQTGERRVIAEPASSPAWLPDSRHLLYSGPTHLTLHDTETGRRQHVIPVDRRISQWGRTISLSKDGRTLVYLQSKDEGDIWLMTLGGER